VSIFGVGVKNVTHTREVQLKKSDDAPPCAKDSELEYAVFGDGIDN